MFTVEFSFITHRTFNKAHFPSWAVSKKKTSNETKEKYWTGSSCHSTPLVLFTFPATKEICQVSMQARIQGFEAPKLSIYGPSLIFLHYSPPHWLGISFLSYLTIFHNSKIVWSHFTWHIISQLVQIESRSHSSWCDLNGSVRGRVSSSR